MENIAEPLPRASRINFRIIIFGVLVVALIGAPLYSMISESITHGIHASAGDGFVVDLKAMGNFQFNGNTGTIKDVPSYYRDLDGKKVVLTGFMFPVGFDSTATSEFQLVYNIQNCCFSGPPRVQERVFAFMPPGRSVEILDGAARVTGILHVKIVEQAGIVSSVYTLEVQNVKAM